MGYARVEEDPVELMFWDLDYDRQAVTLRLTNLGYGSAWIDLIHIQPYSRGLGLGRQVMTHLCQLADYYGVELRLKAIAMQACMPQAQLEAFYRSCGFKVARRDADGHPSMERQPS